MTKNDSKTFLKITNKDIYDEQKETRKVLEELSLHVKEQNGHIKANQVAICNNQKNISGTKKLIVKVVALFVTVFLFIIGWLLKVK